MDNKRGVVGKEWKEDGKERGRVKWVGKKGMDREQERGVLVLSARQTCHLVEQLTQFTGNIGHICSLKFLPSSPPQIDCLSLLTSHKCLQPICASYYGCSCQCSICTYTLCTLVVK